ncbi:MAG TPA: hypothetical protein PK200_14605 [Spirochaetota bacterium]|nr:hypothetical protein [Spirochaetota bacterium]
MSDNIFRMARNMHYILAERTGTMKLSIFEIFIVFWTSAILWVLIEYFFYRFSRSNKRSAPFDQYRED